MGPKKQLGQHFLTSIVHARRIAGSIPAGANENVLEIGPGNGALTVHLVERFAHVHCVEIDEDVVEALTEKIGAGSWTLHRCDALTFDFAKAGFPLHVVGNLPYNIGALLIKKTLLYGNGIRSCTFMVQREVAQRIVAVSHTKENGFLSVFCQFFGTPRIVLRVPAGVFFPKPNVESAVFRIDIEPDLEAKLPVSQWNDYFSFVDKGFRMRRKMLANVLGREGGRVRWVELLRGMDIVDGARAEDLCAAEWLTLYKLSCETP
jgi:16S rRNA (adenine1518-N6/adenine1519-N6)-dimethyltransferase